MAEAVIAPRVVSRRQDASTGATTGGLRDLLTSRAIALAALVACEIGWLASRAVLSGLVRWVPVLVVLALHGALMEMERRHPRLPRSHVTVATAVVAVAAVVIPPFGSQDLYLYATYGRMVTAHHANPYLVTPGAFPHDPMFHHMAAAWTGTRTMYGPAFTGLSALGALLYGRSSLVARLFFQSVAAGSLVAAVVWLQRRRVPTAALLLIGMSPVLVAVANGGHNDLLAGVLAMVGLEAACKGRDGWSGLWLGLAVAVKAIVLPILLVVIAVLVLRRVWTGVARLVVTAGAVLLVGYAIAGGLSALRPLWHMTDVGSRVSLWVSIGHFAGLDGDTVTSPTFTKIALAVLIASLAVAFARRRHRPLEMGRLAVVVEAIVVLELMYVLPWYAAALLPIAALFAGTFTQRAVHIAASALLVAYVLPPGQLTSGLTGASIVGHATGLVIGGIAVAIALAPTTRASGRDRGSEPALVTSTQRP